MRNDQPERRPSPAALHQLRDGLRRAETAIIEAELADRPSERFLAAHHAALQVAAVILALRTRPALRGQRSRPRNAWRMLADVAPEFGEWAGILRSHRGQARRRTRRGDLDRQCSRGRRPGARRAGVSQLWWSGRSASGARGRTRGGRARTA